MQVPIPVEKAEIAQVSPGTELIALSANDDLDDIRAMIRAGAGGYLVKGEGSGEEATRLVSEIKDLEAQLAAAAETTEPDDDASAS